MGDFSSIIVTAVIVVAIFITIIALFARYKNVHLIEYLLYMVRQERMKMEVTVQQNVFMVEQHL